MTTYFTTYPKRFGDGELLAQPKPKRKPRRKPLFQCMECGRKFYSVRSAENAAFGNGCSCGATDIEEI